MAAKKENALLLDVVQFPKAAEKWLQSMGFMVHPWPVVIDTEWEYVFVVFRDHDEAVFYSRRWNGRMGDDLLRRAALESQG